MYRRPTLWTTPSRSCSDSASTVWTAIRSRSAKSSDYGSPPPAHALTSHQWVAASIGIAGSRRCFVLLLRGHVTLERQTLEVVADALVVRVLRIQEVLHLAQHGLRDRRG